MPEPRTETTITVLPFRRIIKYPNSKLSFFIFNANKTFQPLAEIDQSGLKPLKQQRKKIVK